MSRFLHVTLSQKSQSRPAKKIILLSRPAKSRPFYIPAWNPDLGRHSSSSRTLDKWTNNRLRLPTLSRRCKSVVRIQSLLVYIRHELLNSFPNLEQLELEISSGKIHRLGLSEPYQGFITIFTSEH